MKPISNKTRVAAEAVVKALLTDAVKRTGPGKPISVNDADYAEAHGILRGVLAATYGDATAFQKFRLGDGAGDATHESVNQWLRDIGRTVEGCPATWR